MKSAKPEEVQKASAIALPLNKEEVLEQLAALGLQGTNSERLYEYICCCVNDKVDEVVVNLLNPHFGTYHQLTDAGKQEFCNNLLDPSFLDPQQ